MAEHHGPKHYVKIWGILLVLLIVSILGPELEIQVVTLITAFGIAVIKAYLVIKHFMHFNVERRYLHYLLITSLSFMMIFYFGIAPDVLNHEGRRWVNEGAQQEIQRREKEEQERIAKEKNNPESTHQNHSESHH